MARLFENNKKPIACCRAGNWFLKSADVPIGVAGLRGDGRAAAAELHRLAQGAAAAGLTAQSLDVIWHCNRLSSTEFSRWNSVEIRIVILLSLLSFSLTVTSPLTPRQAVAQMAGFGMAPVLQVWGGGVPNAYGRHYPDAQVWGGL